MAGSGTRRRLLLVSTNYAPEQAGTSRYATQIAEHWAAGGAEVHVLTGMPHYPAWRLDPAYAGVRQAEEERGGVRVHRHGHTVPARQTVLGRAGFELSVLRGGLRAAPAIERPDAVIAQLPTPAAGVIGARLARRYGVPFVPVVRNLLGGGDRARLRSAPAGMVERYALRRAALVGVVHPSIVPDVEAMGVPATRIRLIPNWSHLPRPSRPREEMRARLGWRPGQTVALYSGALGAEQDLESLVGAARLDPGLRVVLMGDGERRAELRTLAGGLPNLDFPPSPDDTEYPDVLAAADVLLVAQRAALGGTGVPPELGAYLAAGRPVVAAVPAASATARELDRSGAGLVVPPEDPAALLAAIHALTADPARAAQLAANGPAYAEAHLSRAAGLARIDTLLAEALTPRPTAPPGPAPASPQTAPAPPPASLPMAPASPPASPRMAPPGTSPSAVTGETRETRDTRETGKGAAGEGPGPA
ncbi:glycosyltransferase family 4 protein [Streptomyces sp. NBC_01190]|uniref:glycosyltransferase family 4 protein n=1 Tax=Streptomyces sp. NBC_01190 TaxID=2903767 RepID=UPI00386A0FE4|nr:glycosyltransferase family 4 protein [Streptomyces sp. NBC_01190]